jgi:uncharacterized protein (TIGR03382 family)
VVLQDNTAAINKVIEGVGGGIPGAGCGGCSSVDAAGGLMALVAATAALRRLRMRK